MSLMQEQFAFLKDLAKLIQFIENYCAKTPENDLITGGELLRTPYMQRYYVSAGLSGTINSLHLKKLAADFNFIRDGKLVEIPEEIGGYWESLSPGKNVWGGRWKKPHDPGHFERRV